MAMYSKGALKCMTRVSRRQLIGENEKLTLLWHMECKDNIADVYAKIYKDL